MPIGRSDLLFNQGATYFCRMVLGAEHSISHPITGALLRGEVLKLLTSSFGGLGIVRCDEGAMEWCRALQKYFYGESNDIGMRLLLGKFLLCLSMSV